MPTCTSCGRNQPIWFKKKNTYSYTEFRYCMKCFNDILIEKKLDRKNILLKQRLFVSKRHYWGISNETSILSMLHKQWPAGQFVFWEYWNRKNAALVQVVSYLRCKNLMYGSWYIIPTKKGLYVTKDEYKINKKIVFTSYRFALSFIQNSHIQEVHADEGKCTCRPLSKYSRRNDDYTFTQNAWSLFDLASFSLRNNLFNLDLSLFHRLPEHVTTYVATFDPTAQKSS